VVDGRRGGGGSVVNIVPREVEEERKFQFKISASVPFGERSKRSGRANRAKGRGIHVIPFGAGRDCQSVVRQRAVFLYADPNDHKPFSPILNGFRQLRRKVALDRRIHVTRIRPKVDAFRHIIQKTDSDAGERLWNLLLLLGSSVGRRQRDSLNKKRRCSKKNK
jgi:hypothetical protein